MKLVGLLYIEFPFLKNWKCTAVKVGRENTICQFLFHLLFFTFLQLLILLLYPIFLLSSSSYSLLVKGNCITRAWLQKWDWGLKCSSEGYDSLSVFVFFQIYDFENYSREQYRAMQSTSLQTAAEVSKSKALLLPRRTARSVQQTLRYINICISFIFVLVYLFP